ncbi:MAG: hypothetical protein UD759_01605 [Clostridia bacterium]|nr:hypothetical protein [Clostridia bacterium]
MRMRTIPKAFEAVKRADPNTDLTLRALRRMVNNGSIPTVQVGRKRLVDLDLLFDTLSGYNNSAIRIS